MDRGWGADGDRYELYESPDGGQSWSFKQSSTKPLTLRRPAQVSTDWRLRVDSNTQVTWWSGVGRALDEHSSFAVKGGRV